MIRLLFWKHKGTMDKPPNGEESTAKNTQHPSRNKNSLYYFRNFCDNTSIHGFKFLGERKRSIFEKLFWIIVLGGTFYGSSMLIFNTYNKWVSSPVLITFATTETPIWQIPFPAVTVCAEVSPYKRYFNYSDYNKLFEEENIAIQEGRNFLSQFCADDWNFANFNENKFLNRTEYMNSLYSLDEWMGTCQWLGVETDGCEKLFSNIVTADGWCKTFNMLDYTDIYSYPNNTRYVNATNWTLEGGYPLDEEINTFPRRTVLSGINGGLQVDLISFYDAVDKTCLELQGFKVTIHHPAEEPDMDKHFRLPIDQTVVVGVRPRMITTSKEISRYKAKQRQCYLPGEKYLSTYKIYTEQNCLMECLANYTVQRCQCIPLDLPFSVDQKMFCGTGSTKCVNEAKGKYSLQLQRVQKGWMWLFNFLPIKYCFAVEFLKIEVESELYKKFGKHRTQCDCLPACSSIEFDLELSQIDWHWRRTYSMRSDFSKFNTTINSPFSHMSRLQIYYKDSKFIRSERHEFYGTAEFLANCGGLLGLCCGFSIISLVEIVYYLSIRLIGNFSKFDRRV